MILVGFGPVELTLVVGLAIGASLLASLSYGVAVVYTKTQGTGVQPFALALYSQLFAALVLLPAVPFALPSSSPSGVVMGAVVALGVLCTAVAYLLYFGLIQRVEPTKATMVTYLSPAFGILWGALLLREPLTVWTFVGFGLILLSVAFITGVRVGRLPVRKPTRA